MFSKNKFKKLKKDDQKNLLETSESPVNIFETSKVKVEKKSKKKTFSKNVKKIIDKGNINSLKDYLKTHHIDCKDSMGSTLLHHAVQNQKYDMVEFLLANNANPNICDQWSIAALHFAASINNIEIMSLLLKYKADINSVDLYGRTSLYYAILNKNVEAVKFLISSGASTDQAQQNLIASETYLELAISDNVESSLTIIKLLLSTGKIDVNTINSLTQNSVIFKAIIQKNYPVLEYLVSANADINLRGSGTVTPLHQAIYSSDEDCKIVKLLIDRYADFVAKIGYNHSLMSYIDYAIALGKPKVAKLLEEKFRENKKSAEDTIQILSKKIDKLENLVMQLILDKQEGEKKASRENLYKSKFQSSFFD